MALDREDQWLLDWFSGLQVKVAQPGRRRKQRRELESQEERGGGGAGKARRAGPDLAPSPPKSQGLSNLGIFFPPHLNSS